MFRSIRRALKWLLDWVQKDDDALSSSLEFVVGGKHGQHLKIYRPVHVQGDRLLCLPIDGSSEVRMFAAREAVDSEQFWAAWKGLSKDSGMTWEDGTPFDPTK